MEGRGVDFLTTLTAMDTTTECLWPLQILAIDAFFTLAHSAVTVMSLWLTLCPCPGFWYDLPWGGAAEPVPGSFWSDFPFDGRSTWRQKWNITLLSSCKTVGASKAERDVEQSCGTSLQLQMAVPQKCHMGLWSDLQSEHWLPLALPTPNAEIGK